MPKDTYRIVVGIDFREGSAHAVRETARLATAIGSRTEVHTVTAIEPSWTKVRTALALENVPSEARRFLYVYGHELADNLEVGVAVHGLQGEAVPTLLQLASDVEADLIIVGPHEKGMLDRRTVGSVTTALLRGAHCPVLVARPKDYFDPETSEDILPPCPDCLAARAASSGAQYWCERHAGHQGLGTPERHNWGAVHPGDRSSVRMF